MTADPPLPGLRRTGFTDFTDKESVSIPIPNRDKETKTQRGKPQPKNLNRRKPRKQRVQRSHKGSKPYLRFTDDSSQSAHSQKAQDRKTESGSESPIISVMRQ